MEMSQIRYVLAAAKHLNFTKAASDCNVTQPALTKGVKALEVELGAPVFHREGRRILLSDFGRSMLPHLQQIVSEADAAQLLAQNFRLLEKVPIRLGVMSTIGHIRLARFLAQFEKTNSGVELSVSERSTTELKDKLSNGELDAAVMTLTEELQENFRTHPLYAERYVVVFPPEHRLGQLNVVSLQELSGENYVDRLSCEMREMVMQVCASKGVELYARFRSEREGWVQAMVLAGIGFAFMPEYSVTLPGLIQRPLIDPTVERKIALVTMPGRKFSPAMEALMRSVKNFSWPG
ncbi:LysR family transcriptional regulator [Lutimaribacter saemankumensis]|uniref:DNA-binding transcriptional regulator, LysR family n=1 Tax=Lutimaribacter saemankumensis TaxID=490829 RepID=A0A1G8TVS3_9RHOB|nr:LysR family transcriptional regulator [Lutimaribacter saemankumensis]SDJ45547.1 DNA-binding transcriptional regulator, LysR family [Lutimaribacter saemankumensis]